MAWAVMYDAANARFAGKISSFKISHHSTTHLPHLKLPTNTALALW